MPEPEPQYMTVKEVCDLLRISRATFYRLLRSGDLHGVTISQVTPRGQLRIERSSLLRWAESRRR